MVYPFPKFRQYKRKFHPLGGIFHIYNRGVAKAEIFLEDFDCVVYFNSLKRVLGDCHFNLFFYCLMPNHIHLCVGQKGEATTSNFVHRLHTIYSLYFNKNYDRVGPLFQGRFKQSVVETEEDFFYVGKYIHLNPVRAGLALYPEDYKWSSCYEYIKGGGICDKSIVINHFGNVEKYRTYLREGLNERFNPEVLLL